VDEILEITLFVAEALERLGVPYLVGGSLASSLHGIPRATQDADLVASLGMEHLAPLTAVLEGSFYFDRPAMAEAIHQRSSFNVIHLETLFKVDVFVARDDPATRQEMQRRERFVISDDPLRELVVATPEDIVVQKLLWYRLGEEVSERQWSDALGVLRVAGPRLDVSYLRRIAALLGVEELLLRACEAAGLPVEGR
jgi:hypothetical protein